MNRPTTTSAFVSLPLLAGALLLGCAEDPAKPPKTAAAPPPTAPPAEDASDSEPPSGPRPIVQKIVQLELHVETSLAQACGLTKPHAFFEYDSEQLKDDGKATLGKIVECLDEGPMSEAELAVVGHADPRGEPDYNEELGHDRAESVVEYLVEEGIARDRLTVETKGEQLAEEDRENYQWDRRVDLRLKT